MRTPSAFLRPLGPCRARGSAFVATLVLLAVVAGPASANVFRWVDASGTPHFSDRPEDVPPEYRDQLEDGGAAASPQATSRFVVVPGLNNVPEDGAPVQPIDEAAFEAEALAALSDFEQGGGRLTPDIGSLLKQGAPFVAGAIGVALVALGIVLAIAALILKLACRICGEEPPGLGKGMGIVLLQSLAVGALGFLVALLTMGSGSALQVQSAQFGTGVLIQAGVLRGMLIESYGKSLAVTAVTIGIQLAIGFALGIAVFALMAVSS
jgi:hypothetical protein